MPDEIDRAQEQEAQYLAACLANARARAGCSEPQERDEQGRVVCADCGETIPPARLAKVPTATRCTKCQEETDHGGRQ